MVKKLTKRTKKFEATKLKGVIQHRRKYQKQKRQRTKKSGLFFFSLYLKISI